MPIEMDILLIDDHPIVRLGFGALLSRLGHRIRVHEAGDAAQALALAACHKPAVALLDLSLAGMLGLDLIGQLHAVVPRMAVLVVSMHDERIYAERAVRAGALGYVMKQTAAKSIIQAIQTVCEGRIWLSEELRSGMIKRLLDKPDCGDLTRLATLSNRELEVFRMAGLGLKKAEMAARLNLSPNTIETYRLHIKQKLGLSSSAELHRTAFLHFQNENALGG
jgi:DNA-binding NarL/FixJ family response regulator